MYLIVMVMINSQTEGRSGIGVICRFTLTEHVLNSEQGNAVMALKPEMKNEKRKGHPYLEIQCLEILISPQRLALKT